MYETEKMELKESEKKELRKIAKEAEAVYEFIDKEGLSGNWTGDTERFMALTFSHTKTLVRHSNTLTRLTRWLIGLTIALIILSIVHIIFLILSRLPLFVI